MENIFYALLATYIVMLVFLLIFIDLTISGNCGAIIKFSNKDIISEDKYDVDYWGVDRWTEKSITCKSCNRKIHLR